MGRHATDRKDWTLYAECADHGADHLRVEASAKGASEGYQNPSELLPLDECGVCGGEIAYIQQDEPTEVFD